MLTEVGMAEGPCLIKRCPRRKVHVQTPQGSVVTYEVDRSETVHNLKKKVQAQLAFCTEQSDLVFGSQVLENGVSLSKAGVQTDVPVLLRRRGLSRSQSSPCLTPLADACNAEFADDDDCDKADGVPIKHRPAVPVVPVGSSRCAAAVKPIVRVLLHGLRKGAQPRLEKEGLGGAYFFPNARGETVAILKPSDEEPLAPNNPKGFVGKTLGERGLKRSVRVGEAAIREAAAFLLDHDHFARVPRTALVKATHSVFHYANDQLPSVFPNCSDNSPLPKLSSLQEFIKHDYDASEHSPSAFPTAEVHRLGILDLRIFNTDRHAGNILVRNKGKSDHRHLGRALSSISLRHAASDGRDGGVQLVPIDHGYCLPERVEGAYFEWLFWPQATLPFTAEELDYIASIDVRRDLNMLRAELPMLQQGCLRVLEVSSTLLQLGAAAGLSMADLGNIMSRPLVGVDEDPSQLEVLVSRAVVEAKELVAASAGAHPEPESEWAMSDEDGDWSDLEEEGEGAPAAAMGVAMSPCSQASSAYPRTFMSNMEDVLQFEFEDDGSSNEGSLSMSPGLRGALSGPNPVSLSNSAGSTTDSDFSLSPTPKPLRQLALGQRWGDAGDSDEEEDEEEDHALPEAAFGSRPSLAIKIEGPTTPLSTLQAHYNSSEGSSNPSSFEPVCGSMQTRGRAATTTLLGMRTPNSPMRKRSGRNRPFRQARGRLPGRRCDRLGVHGLMSKRQSPLGMEQIAHHCDLGKLSDAEWTVFRDVFCKQLEESLKSGGWKSSMKLVTDEGTCLQNFGTSCPRF